MSVIIKNVFLWKLRIIWARVLCTITVSVYLHFQHFSSINFICHLTIVQKKQRRNEFQSEVRHGNSSNYCVSAGEFRTSVKLGSSKELFYSVSVDSVQSTTYVKIKLKMCKQTHTEDKQINELSILLEY